MQLPNFLFVYFWSYVIQWLHVYIIFYFSHVGIPAVTILKSDVVPWQPLALYYFMIFCDFIIRVVTFYFSSHNCVNLCNTVNIQNRKFIDSLDKMMFVVILLHSHRHENEKCMDI